MSTALETVTRSRWVWAALGVALGLVLASGGVTAQQQTATVTSTEAMTVYVSGHGGKELAADLNKVHQTHAVPAGPRWR